jgi:HEAT repeat protein
LIGALQAEDPAVREKAVYTLGEIKDARAVQPLIALLKDPDQLVRSEAAQVLGDMQDPQAVDPLSAALQDKSIQNDVIEALTKLNDPRAIPALIAVMGTGDLYYCTPCFPAEKALVKLGAPAVQPLNAALQDASPNVRRWSAKALQQIGDERSVAPLIAAIQRGDVEVAAGAYIFFIEKGLGGSETVLVQALDKYAGMDNDGGQKMAEDFLNSGNSLLEAGARKWASANQYRVTQGVGTGGPRWGSAAP